MKSGSSAIAPLADVDQIWSYDAMRLIFLALFALAACSSNSSEDVTEQRFEGFVEVGSHGPVFTPLAVFNGTPGEYVPWRMSSRDQAFDKALEKVLEEGDKPYGTPIRAEFLGVEVPVQPNGVGFEREVEVRKWTKLTVCSEGLTACVLQ